MTWQFSMVLGALALLAMARTNAYADTTTPPSGSSCELLSTCESECTAGNQASCVRAAEHYRDGRGRVANKEQAARILKQSCDKHRHPRACMEYGWMVREGWMFEVERNGRAFREYADVRARSFASSGCQGGDMDACLVKADVEKRLLDQDGWPDPATKDRKLAEAVSRAKTAVTTMLAGSRAACAAGHGAACQWMIDNVDDIAARGYLARKGDSASKGPNAKALKTEANNGFQNACSKGDNAACNVYIMALLDDDGDEKVGEARTTLAAPCKRNNAEACFILTALDLFAPADADAEETEEATKKRAIATIETLEKHCARAGGEVGAELCDDIASMFAEGGEEEMGFDKPDPKRALTLLSKRCANGFIDSCESLDKMAAGGDDREPSPKFARIAKQKTCELTPYGTRCDLCAATSGSGPQLSNAKHPMCRTRLAWKENLDCEEGKEDRCEVLATMYRTGDGVEQSVSRSIDYYRLACDSALKSSCSTLEVLCRDSKELESNERCKQSLIHTDVFYEAEWQFRQTGSARILGEEAGLTSEIGEVSVGAQASGTGDFSLARGSLDADLVVSIVLDRAREAAIRLVVSELKRTAKGSFVPIYLEDLLTQASLLLSDSSSMRREKFQDLGMTVVRAFVASNLTKTLFPEDTMLLGDAHWSQWAKASKVQWHPEKFRKADLVKLRGYLTDWTYHELAGTPLFGRATGDTMRLPACPFESAATRIACKLIATDAGKPHLDRLAQMLRIDAMLQGLSLAKALRAEGSIDLRRFIEAIGRSQTIANLHSTPGLNLDQWKRDVADATETRLRDLQVQLDAAQAAFTREGWARLTTSAQVETIRKRALGIVGKDSPYLALLDAENVQAARGLLTYAEGIEKSLATIERLEAQLASSGGLSLSGGGANPEQLESALGAARGELSKAGERLMAGIEKWEDAGALLAKLETIRGGLDATRPLMLQFRRSLVEIETVLRRHKPPRKPGTDVTVELESKFEISHVPLHALPDLRKHFQNVATSLVEIDKQMGQVFPGSSRTKLKFAVSAVVRLLGFFDLMERVARKARLNQTCGDVIEALRLLGSVQSNTFSAPLFDVMDPVLHAIKTHEPMDVDQLFTVISKVRLDSLITSLAENRPKPCETDEKGYECWTFKIIHSLQESVQHEGGSIRIDGGAFAKRLATHGDDFRRRHKWRSYFHLTVGLGGLVSELPPSADAMPGAEDSRVVPLLGEQIGFGWASPTLYDDTFTFKFGAYGSGILYRAALDSSESNAIMASPFVALDFYDLVELYAGPMVLFYPPTDTDDAAIRFGASVGLTVPLSAYLERL